MSDLFFFSTEAPKRPANVSINEDLLRVAKEMKVNLSRTLETSLIEIVRARQRESWLEENRAAIDAYNERVARKGVFSDGLRRF